METSRSDDHRRRRDRLQRAMEDSLTNRHNRSAAMTSNLGRLWFQFSDPISQNRGTYVDRDYVQFFSNLNGSRMNGSFEFNDIEFYRSLWKEDGCVKAEISSVCVRHNMYCHGVQAIYRLTFADGRTETREGPRNYFTSGYYFYAAFHRSRPITRVDLEEDEFLTGIRVKQGEIVDGITLVTNRRRVHCGGQGGDWIDWIEDNPPSMRIVAFCGTEKGVCERIGFYAKVFAWETIGVYILMRKLVQQGRAEIVSLSTRDGNVSKEARRTSFSTQRPNIFYHSEDFQFAMQRLVTLDDGVFRNVMKFLA